MSRNAACTLHYARTTEPLIQTTDQGWLALAARVVKQAVDDCQQAVLHGFLSRSLDPVREPDPRSGRNQVNASDVESQDAADWLRGPGALELCELISASSGLPVHRDHFLRRITQP
jgi:hypothetical protein